MRCLELYNPTPLIESLIKYKQVTYKIKRGACPAFPDYDEPILREGQDWIVGLYPILGYLDRRVIWPTFFPPDPQDYAKVAMVLDLFFKTPPRVTDWIPIVQISDFVLGDEPCVIDLILAGLDSTDPDWQAYTRRVKHRLGASATEAA